MHKTVTDCLRKDPSERPNLIELKLETHLFLFNAYCALKTEKGDKSAIELLQRADFQLNYKNIDAGNTALHCAAAKSRTEVISAFLDMPDSQINLFNKQGYSVLDVLVLYEDK